MHLLSALSGAWLEYAFVSNKVKTSWGLVYFKNPTELNLVHFFKCLKTKPNSGW